MASKHQIKVEGVADFSSIAKEAESLQNTLKSTFGDKGMQIFDKNSVKFLQRESQQAFDKLKGQLRKLRDEAKQLEKDMKAATNPSEAEAIGQKRLESLKKIANAERSMFQLRSRQKEIETGRPGNAPSFTGLATKTALGGAMGVAGQLPGLSTVASAGSSAASAGSAAMAAGLGAPAIAGLAALAVAAVAAGAAVSRMVTGFETFQRAIPNLLGLSGMGITPERRGRATGAAAELGYSQLDVFDAQMGLNRAFGRSKDQRSEQNRIINTLTASRGLGISPDQISSGGNALRSVGGTESAQKQMSMILEKAFTSGMDKSQAAHYLSASVGLLSELNQSGVANSSQLMGVMASLTAKGAMSPEMAARMIGGVNSAISNSSGEANAFFQNAAVGQGLGNGTLTGTQFAVRQGLQGVDLQALQNQIGDTAGGRSSIAAISAMGLGGKDYSKRMATGILDQTDRFGSSQEGQAAKLNFVNQMFGGKTATDAAKVLHLLEKIKAGSDTKQDRKVLEDLGKDPQESWRTKTIASLDKIALSTQATAAWSENAKFNLGETSAPIFNKLTDAVTKLDTTLNKMMGGEGEESKPSMPNTAFPSMGESIMGGIKDLFGIGSGDKAAQEAFMQKNTRLHDLTGTTVRPDGSPVIDSSFRPKKLTPEESKEAKDLYDQLSKNKKAGGLTGESADSKIFLDFNNEQKKTNALLERIARPGNAPKTMREPTRK